MQCSLSQKNKSLLQGRLSQLVVLGNEMTGAVAEARESDSGMGGAAKGQDLVQ